MPRDSLYLADDAPRFGQDVQREHRKRAIEGPVRIGKRVGIAKLEGDSGIPRPRAGEIEVWRRGVETRCGGHPGLFERQGEAHDRLENAVATMDAGERRELMDVAVAQSDAEKPRQPVTD